MITPLDSAIKGVMDFTWPMVFISILLLASIHITDIIKNRKPFILYKEVFLLLFLIYIFCLFQVVTFEDSIVGNNNLVLFREITRYTFGSRLFFKNVIGNIVLFIPYGIFASTYAKLEKWYQAFGLVFFASCVIEITQLMIGRVFDIDDILLNIFGGLIGYFMYKIVYVLGDKLPKTFRSNWFLNLLTVLILVLLCSYIWVVLI